MKVAVWSPLPPAASGIADYVAESLPALARHFDVTAVVEDPEAVDPALRAEAFVVTSPGLATAAKRLDVAARVVARLRADHPETMLVVAGEADPRLPLAAWAAEAGLGDGLRVTGRLALADFERLR